jgi:hypothetical protein
VAVEGEPEQWAEEADVEYASGERDAPDDREDHAGSAAGGDAPND